MAELFVSVGADVSAAVAGLTALGTQLESTKGLFERAAPAAELMVGAGIGLAVGLGAATAAAADFDAKLTAVRNNTTQTDADMALMRATVLRLGSEAPVSLDNLAEGFMHITNFGFSAADSTLVLEAAMRSAVSTGGNTSATAEVLAAILHEFGLSAGEAAATMDKLHIASAEGNLTLEQFSQSFGQVAAFAAAVGVPLDQAAAAMAAMTRHGFDAATAATQVKDEIVHLINPSVAAEKHIRDLSNATGIDLVSAFSATGLHALGLTGVMDLTTEAMNRAGLSSDEQTALWLKLVPNIRGGAAAFVLAGRGAQDFRDILGDMNNSIGITDEAFARMQNQAKFQWDLLSNQFHILGITVGEILLPPLEAGVGIVSGFVSQFQALSTPVQTLIVNIAAAGAVVLTLGGAFVLLAPFIGALPAAFGALGLALGAVAIPIAIIGAAAFGLFQAWQSNFGGIRDIVLNTFDRIRPILENFRIVFEKTISGDISGALDTFRAILTALFPDVSRVIGDLSATLSDFASQTVGFFQSNVIPAFERFASFVQGTVLPVLLDFASNVMPTLQSAAASLADFWNSTLQPAFAATATVISERIVPFFVTLGEQFASFTGGAGNAIVTFFRDDLPPALAALGVQVQSLGPLFGTLGEFFGSVTNLMSALGTVGSTALRGLFENVLVPGFQQLAQALGPIQPTLDATGQAIQNMASGFTTIGAALEPVRTFFENLTTTMNALADALARPELAPILTPGSGARIPGIPGAGPEGGPNPALVAAGNASNALNPLVQIGTLIIKAEDAKDFIQEMAAQVAAAAGRVNAPPDNSAFPALAPAQ